MPFMPQYCEIYPYLIAHCVTCFSIIYSIWILFFRQTNCGVFFCCFDVIMTTTPCYYLCSTTFKKVLLRIHIFTYARHSINLHALKHRTSEQNFGGGISSQTLKVSDMLKFSKTHGGLCRIQQARGQCKEHNSRSSPVHYLSI